ncbi:protein D2 isoform X2 [Bemisia tabaci]|uniref:protein D2 isoform X2 n=1 Tax=Bemisia tabaci TaxID=7038 RepID=UPI003B27D263
MHCILSATATLIVFYFQLVNPSNFGRLKNAAALRKLMHEKKIIPDLIDEAPLQAVQYRSPSFSFGEKVTIYDIVETPQVVNWTIKKDAQYTLIMTGLDVPSREDHKDREYLHWLVVNIPGRNIKKGNHLPEYKGAIYEYQEGNHRIVYLVYRQKEKLHLKGDHHHPDSLKVKRENFSTRHFVNEHRLGAPFAINWAEVDKSPDIIFTPDMDPYEDEDDS